MGADFLRGLWGRALQKLPGVHLKARLLHDRGRQLREALHTEPFLSVQRIWALPQLPFAAGFASSLTFPIRQTKSQQRWWQREVKGICLMLPHITRLQRYPSSRNNMLAGWVTEHRLHSPGEVCGAPRVLSRVPRTNVPVA